MINKQKYLLLILLPTCSSHIDTESRRSGEDGNKSITVPLVSNVYSTGGHETNIER